MRSDIIAYIIGSIFLSIAVYSLWNREGMEPLMGGTLLYSAVVFVYILFGATAFIFGYALRPKKVIRYSADYSPVSKLMDLTEIEGIGQKRADQLKSIGISTVADLSVASENAIADGCRVPTKTARRWIENARNQLLEKT